MKGLVPLFLGLFGTFAFSWLGLTLIPNSQLGHLDPQSDEEGTDIYPMPKSGMAERGRQVYTANGCFYCHSQQIRADYASDDIDRVRDLAQEDKIKWAARRSAPRDYVFDRPVLLGKMRSGPDLANIGKSAPAAEDENAAAGASPAPAPAAGASPAASPAGSTSSPAPAPPNASPAPSASPAPEKKPRDTYSAEWHHRHLYSPRAFNSDSNMPAYRFLYEKRRISGEPSAVALKLSGRDMPPAGFEIVPTYDAECLVAYLLSLDQSHPLKEVKAAAAAPPAASPSPSPAPANPPKPK